MEINSVVNEQKMIFGSLFTVSNMLQKLMDKKLASFDMTSKQWFMTAIIEYFFETAPSLNELAKLMGYSHQNVKQIVLKLEKRGFVKIEKDKKDQRALRISLTEKSYSFWRDREHQADKFVEKMFMGLNDSELSHASRVMQVITNNLKGMDNEE